MFGGGNIGRGFIGAVLAEAGYQIVFADVNTELLDKLNELGKYTVHIRDTECRNQLVEHVRGVNSTTEDIIKEIMVVYKHDSRTNITRLTSEERIEEVAKMLSGSEITSAAIEQAKLLLG